MADVFSRRERSRVMSRVGSKDTKPEKIVRSAVHREGFRFRLHRRDLPGTPDIVLPRHQKVIFVHGCFWHGHSGCSRSRRPTSNTEFWNGKLDKNIARDKSNKRKLRRLGWKVLVVWECETKAREKLHRKLRRFLHAGD